MRYSCGTAASVTAVKSLAWLLTYGILVEKASMTVALSAKFINVLYNPTMGNIIMTTSVTISPTVRTWSHGICIVSARTIEKCITGFYAKFPGFHRC